MLEKKLTGLFFGTFNPIHIGHLAIANYMLEHTEIEELWFVVTPQSPFKEKQTVFDDRRRLEMVKLAIENHQNYQVCDIEFNMPKPSYTIDTILNLTDKHKNRKFALIMGADNILNLHKWKNYEQLLNLCPVYVYPRIGYSTANIKVSGDFRFVNSPIIEISSSYIRKSIAENKDICFFVPEKVYQYIVNAGLYKVKN